ncbi:(2Fe-2S)-binding protein [Streptomyces sannanensis]|uniref:(2Fe-2S)-binding protein n=1 Tax=Streptomyces sannanensis TaxID=285536 RepID=A0ABP6SMA3_9ACTN
MDDRAEPAAAPGGFFALRTDPPGGGSHVPLAEVYTGRSAALRARIDTVAARLRTDERRVAASLAYQGLASRLWSVALAPAALHGILPGLAPAVLRWDPAAAAPDDLWTEGPAAGEATVEGIREAVQYAHLAPLAQAMRRECRVSPRLLWGDAGSALAGAVRELDRWARVHGRPEAARRARELGAGLFAHPDLSDGTLNGTAFRRAGCCLYYRVPGGGLCGDCVFAAPGRSAPSRKS